MLFEGSAADLETVRQNVLKSGRVGRLAGRYGHGRAGRAAAGGRLLFQLGQTLFHGVLVKFRGFAFDDLQRAGGAVADAGSQAVAKSIADHAGLSFCQLYRPLGAGDYAAAAAVA